jgi:protein disulfide-isomerase A6
MCFINGSLATILEKRTLAPSKLDEIKVKANIIKAFFEGEGKGKGKESVAQKETAEL